MEANRLTNLKTFGNEFTWRKRKQGPDNILEKLDRILVDDTIKLWYPDLKTKNHSFGASDHCQISANLMNNNNWKAQPFRFEMMWT